MENTKKCTKCGRELPLDQFYKRNPRNGKAGRQYHCKDCQNAANSEWRKKNSEYDTKWQKANPEKKKISNARWRKNNPEKVSQWQKDNPEKQRAIVRKSINKRRANNLTLRLKHNIHSRMLSALRGRVKSDNTIKLLGCSIEHLRNHLEKQFTEGMTWSNYGLHGWHVDHIIPVSYFDLSDPEQQKRAWHYTNLRPMWAGDNIRKSNKIIEVQLILL
jgi:DNA-directed RNA polymerase subunit RPC12/RpoP